MTVKPFGDNWYESSDTVVALASDMLRAGCFDPVNAGYGSSEAENMLTYFEKPWHYTPEHTWWVVNGQTDSGELWEVGYDTDMNPSREWVLKADEPDENGVDLGWLVDFGWVGIKEATIFKAEERTVLADGHWEAFNG